MRIASTRYIFLFLSLFLLLAGCVAKPKYNDVVTTKPLNRGEPANTRVSAAIGEWRNSGVQVTKNKHYQISATGQWRTYPTCNFTGPDGVGLYTSLCYKTPLFPAVIDGFSHSSLIAKIGATGTPFVVGSDYEFDAQNNGILFFRINDALNYTGDNEGFVNVKIIAAEGITDLSQSGDADKSKPALKQAISGPAHFSSATAKIPLDVVQSRASRRTALVIGNSDYAFSPLKNPVNDAGAMATSLEQLGFDVALHLNADQKQMEMAIDEFGRKLAAGNHVALFYYAGHRVQVDGENYLIPTDAVINRQSDVRYKAVNIGQVLGAMGEARDNLNIVILDACRDNPLPRSFRSAGRGLARLEGPKGTVIGFATSPGSVASDGEGDNGVYTKHILQNMREPGLSIEQVFKKVLQGVNEETNGRQIPWTESSFTGNFSFVP